MSGQTTNYTWDVLAGLPVVLQDGTNTYVYGLDLISATDSAGVQTYFLYDGLGSTTDLTDANGNSVAGYSYDVFGAIRTQSGASPNYWLFTGEQRDSDSSFYYLRARYYDPAIGRFLGQDPLPMGNLYAYAGNNPLRYVDPSGFVGVGPGAIPFGPCTNFGSPVCEGGGGRGGGIGTIVIIGGVAYVITATGAVAVGAAEGILEGAGNVITDALEGLGSLFSKGGKSEKDRINSIASLSADVHSDLCRLPTLRYKSSVEAQIQARIKNIQNEYGHLGPTAKRKAERIFKEVVWDNPCDPEPSTPLFPPIFGRSDGGGKE